MLPTTIEIPSTYGVLLIGVLFATFFQGILTVQVYGYYQDFPEDPRATKTLVAVLWILDLIHLILISYQVYYYLIDSWGNVQGVTRIIIPLSLNFFPIAFSVLFSQLFFLYRIWIFSERSVWIVGPIFLCCLATFALISTMGVLTSFQPRSIQLMLAMVIVGALTDILIAALLCYYVRKRSEGTRDMRVTSTLVTQVIRYTVATSAFTSLLILVCLFTYFASPFTFAFVSLHFLSGRTYANAVLVNLNARRKFREALESMEPSFAKSADFAGISSAIRRMPTLNTNASLYEPSYRVHTSTTMSRSMTGENKCKPPIMQAPPNTYQSDSRRHSLP